MSGGILVGFSIGCFVGSLATMAATFLDAYYERRRTEVCRRLCLIP